MRLSTVPCDGVPLQAVGLVPADGVDSVLSLSTTGRFNWFTHCRVRQTTYVLATESESDPIRSVDRVQVHAAALEWRAAALALIEEVCLACSPSMLYCGPLSGPAGVPQYSVIVYCATSEHRCDRA